MAINAIFDKVPWIKGAWGASEVEFIEEPLSLSPRNANPYYRSLNDTDDLGSGICLGMCAEGAIEFDLGLRRHDAHPFRFNPLNDEEKARDWILQGDWFRGMLHQVGKDYARKFLKRFAGVQSRYAWDNGNESDGNYWDYMANVDGIPDFNAHNSTTEQDVRMFLDQLERDDTYINIQRLCRLSDKELLIFQRGYAERLISRGLTYKDMTELDAYLHYKELVGAHVI